MDERPRRPLRLLYVAPERFNNERFREAIAHVRVSLFAVDEAHCISEWGHNFRPDYLKLAEFARQLSAPSACWPSPPPPRRRCCDDICRGFAIRCRVRRPHRLLSPEPDAPDHAGRDAHRDALLLERLRTRRPAPTIVYVTLQRTAEEVADGSIAAGFAGRAYHAGMEDDDRAARAGLVHDLGTTASSWPRSPSAWASTRRDIRYVYHYNLPKSLENYSQEIGRAGRDGEPRPASSCLPRRPERPGELRLRRHAHARRGSRVRPRSSLAGRRVRRQHLRALRPHDIRSLVRAHAADLPGTDGLPGGGHAVLLGLSIQAAPSSAEILARFNASGESSCAGLPTDRKSANLVEDRR